MKTASFGLMAIFLVCAGFPCSVLAQETAPAVTQTPSVAAPEPAKTTLDEIVVTGQLDQQRDQIVPSLGGSEYDFSHTQIETGAQGQNAPFDQVLLRAPGVAQDSYGQVHVRGEHANLQYRINDVLLPEGISGFGQELDTRFVDSMSLITGSLPAQYGLRTAGVVDIHTRSGAFVDGGTGTIYGGSFDTIRPSVEYGGQNGALSYYFTGSYEQNSLGIENPTSSYNAIHDQTEQYKGFTYLSYLLDPTSRVSLILSGSDAHFQIPNNPGQVQNFTLTGVPTFDSSNLNENQYEQNEYAVVAYQKELDKLSLQLATFTRYSAVNFHPDAQGDLIFNGVASTVDRNIFSNGFEGDLSYELNDHHTLRAGTIVTVEDATADTSTLVFPIDAFGNPTSSTPFAIQDNNQKTGYLYGVYLQDEWKITDKLTINYGARFDVMNAYVSANQLSPRINFVYKWDKDTTFHAGYARYFTPPPMELVNSSSVAKFNGTTNASATTQSSPVEPERSHYFDVGVTHQFTKEFQMGVDGYYKIAHDQLDEGQFGSAVIFSPFNYRVGEVMGVEVTSAYSKDGFSAYTNFGVSRAMGKDIVSGEFQFDPAELAYIHDNWVHLDHDQLLTASAGVSYKIYNTMVYSDLLFGSGLRDGFANSDHLPSYWTMNVGISHSFDVPHFGKVTARFDIVNLLDKIYELRDGSGIGVGAPQFGARRGFYGSLSMSF